MTGATQPRRGRGKSKASIELIAAARRILVEIQPATVRAVCYRLFTEKLIDKMTKANTDKVSKQLVWARSKCQMVQSQGSATCFAVAIAARSGPEISRTAGISM